MVRAHQMIQEGTQLMAEGYALLSSSISSSTPISASEPEAVDIKPFTPPKKPRKKADKDPNRIKRLTGYLMFCQERRKTLDTKGHAPGEIMTLLGHEWKELGDEKKKSYDEKAKEYNADLEKAHGAAEEKKTEKVPEKELKIEKKIETPPSPKAEPKTVSEDEIKKEKKKHKKKHKKEKRKEKSSE